MVLSPLRRVFLLLLLAPLACAAANAAQRVYLGASSVAAGAVALDGSPGVYYIARGAEARKYVILQKGGGWCASAASCAARAGTALGSSNETFCPPAIDYATFSETSAFLLLSNDAGVNPQAWNWTRVFLPYVDGGSQVGDADAPQEVLTAAGARRIFYRGARLRRWLAAALLADEGLAAATDVLLAGGSAGGLATFLHADAWAAALPAAAKVVAVPDSGFFLNYNYTAGSGYGSDMRWIFAAMNASGALPPACLAAFADDPALCMFAEAVAPTLRTPTFALQSTYDAFQIPDIAHLQPKDSAAINAYGRELEARLNATFLAGTHHGAFVDSCYHHVGEWGNISIDGQVQAQALLEFYNGLGTPGGKRLWRQGQRYPCAACCHGGQQPPPPQQPQPPPQPQQPQQQQQQPLPPPPLSPPPRVALGPEWTWAPGELTGFDALPAGNFTQVAAAAACAAAPSSCFGFSARSASRVPRADEALPTVFRSSTVAAPAAGGAAPWQSWLRCGVSAPCPPPPPCARGAWAAPLAGYLATGGDVLPPAAAPLADAQAACAQAAGCAGITFQSNASDGGGDKLLVFFKDAFDETDAAGWWAWQLCVTT